jgi:RNA polymerase sigma-70 factor (ECF subfamily)
VSARSASVFARLRAGEHEEHGAREDGVSARGVAARARSGDAASGGDAAERALIEAAQRDCSKFGGLYEANFERVYAYVARRVRDRDEAQDLTADVFHRALKNLARFEWRGVPFAAWLYRIAANEIADRSKKVAKRRAHSDVNAAELAADGGFGIAAGFEEAERSARLFKLVDGLPRDQSRVIAMRFAEDKSIREIAIALKRSEGSIKQLQFRGLQNLRLRLGDSNG